MGRVPRGALPRIGRIIRATRIPRHRRGENCQNFVKDACTALAEDGHLDEERLSVIWDDVLQPYWGEQQRAFEDEEQDQATRILSAEYVVDTDDSD